jgi:hypothetical protein
MLTTEQALALAGYALRGPVWHGEPGDASTSSLTGYAERYGTSGHHVLDVRPSSAEARKGLRTVFTLEERRRLRLTKQDVRLVRRRDVTAAILAQQARKEQRAAQSARYRERHAEELKAKRRARRKRDREYLRAWRAKNKIGVGEAA